MLKIRVQPLSVPKAGNQPDENEDACDYDKTSNCIAIADGATDGFECGWWSNILVRQFVREPPQFDHQSILNWLKSPIEEWSSEIKWDELPWYGAEKANRGAFSTLLGVVFALPTRSITEPEEPAVATWSAMALGDSCLFQVRHDQLISSFPITQHSNFDNTPPLFSTHLSYSHGCLDQLKMAGGALEPSDVFFLATDALAAWFLKQTEEGHKPWEQLVHLNDDEFLAFVNQLRQEGVLRNDDVTLLTVWITEDD